MKAKFLFGVVFLLLTACVRVTTQPTSTPTSQPADMVNPASAYCELQGNKLEIRTDPNGNQTGFCIFPDGSECEEWAYYRKECAPTNQGGSMPNPASAYCVAQGNQSQIRTATDGSQSGMCIFPDGSECDEWAYFRGECKPGSSMPNPAATYCVDQGYKSEIRTASDGSQSGVCIFPDGSECDEWAYFRAECTPTQFDEQGWKIYTNTELGYSFHYPAKAELVISDEPKKSLMIYGEGMGKEFWGISHPGNMDEFRPPEDVDLLQWLTDHHLVGEVRMPDEQIAGTTAIRYRHEGSPQSTPDDRYYFAKSGQLYMILIGHGSDTEDWELNNRFLQSFQFEEPSTNKTPTSIPTALPIDPVAYQDWMTYTNSTYNFTIRLPDDWIVEEVTAHDSLLAGHEIILHTIYKSQKQTIRVTFRRVGEDTLLWPTGVGQGEFIPQGTLDIAGQPAQRILLVCPTGEVTAIWYHQAEGQPNIVRGNVEFGFIFKASEHCEPGNSLSGEVQQVGETIISSLQVP